MRSLSEGGGSRRSILVSSCCHRSGIRTLLDSEHLPQSVPSPVKVHLRGGHGDVENVRDLPDRYVEPVVQDDRRALLRRKAPNASSTATSSSGGGASAPGCGVARRRRRFSSSLARRKATRYNQARGFLTDPDRSTYRVNASETTSSARSRLRVYT